MKHILRISLFYYLPVAVLCVLVYLPTFTGEFILDDQPLIEKNVHVKEIKNPLLFFFHEDGVVDRSLVADYHTGYYRPLTNITYWLDYRLWGMNPGGFRTTNLALHIAASLLLFHFLVQFCRSPNACLAAVLVFALHPVHTESVAFVTSRNNILVTIFSLCCMLCWVNGSENRGRGYYSASVLFYAIALGFKEFAVMVLPALFVYQRLERGMLPVNFREIASYVPFVLITLLYLFARQSVTGAFLSPSDDGSFFLRLVYAPWLVLLNLKYLLFPLGLHSFIFWYPKELMSFESISGVLGLVLLAGFVWIFRRNRAVVFAFAGFLLALFPVLNIIRTSAVTLVSLRWLYFPFVFLAVALAVLVSRGLNRRWHLTTVVLAVVLVYFGGYSYVLNQYLWHDEETFFRQEATHFDNAYYFSGFARQLHREGSHEQAMVYYDRALDRYPRDPDLRISYGGFLADTGRLDEAVRELRKAEKLLRVPIHKARWYNNIGTVYFMKKDYRKALGYYRSAVSLVPGDELFRANEGSALGAMGRYDEAIRVFKKGLEFNPESGMLLRRLEFALRKKNSKSSLIQE